MNFIAAVKLLQLDKNVKLMRRDKDFKICADFHGITKILTKEGYRYFTLSNDDILAEDWYVVKDEKLHTFEEALKAYKLGKRIIRKIENWDDNKACWDISSKDDYALQKEDVMANDWIIIDKEETK